MRNIQELVSSFQLFFTVRLKNARDFLQTAFHYYKNSSFAFIDLMLLFSYFWKSPYRIAREFAEPKGDEAGSIYGETPLLTLEQIVQAAHITQEDVVYELGSGRGRSCFWLASFIGCKVVGVEYNPLFVRKAKRILQLFDKKEILSFVLGDMETADFHDATCIYLYGTTLSETTIQALQKRFLELPIGTTIISVSYTLQGQSKNRQLTLSSTLPIELLWGHTICYIHTVSARPPLSQTVQ